MKCPSWVVLGWTKWTLTREPIIDDRLHRSCSRKTRHSRPSNGAITARLLKAICSARFLARVSLTKTIPTTNVSMTTPKMACNDRATMADGQFSVTRLKPKPMVVWVSRLKINSEVKSRTFSRHGISSDTTPLSAWFDESPALASSLLTYVFSFLKSFEIVHNFI